MTVPATTRIVKAFEDRAEALAHFFARAGEAPRFLAFDDTVGCPLDQALAALEWTAAAGILNPDDLIHAARVGPDAAAVIVERREAGEGGAEGADHRVFTYFGPRMDAPPADPREATLLYDGPGMRAYVFADRGQAIGHFLRATGGAGAILALLGRRAPELRHIRRWLQEVFAEPMVGRSTHIMAAWFAVGGAGCLFLPFQADEPYSYCEVGIDS